MGIQNDPRFVRETEYDFRAEIIKSSIKKNCLRMRVSYRRKRFRAITIAMGENHTRWLLPEIASWSISNFQRSQTNLWSMFSRWSEDILSYNIQGTESYRWNINHKIDKWISAEEIILYLYFYQSLLINLEAFFKPTSPVWGNLS